MTAYDLTILHTNDVADRKEQFDDIYAKCSEDEASNGECFGGFARQATAISDIRGSEENVLLVDAGDQFQGTLWFYYYMGRATSYFMNRLGYDVMTLGNHEFDLNPDGLAPFLRDVDFPVVSANIDASLEPIIEGLLSKSVILNVGGEYIGVVGYTYQRTNEVSKTRRVIFNDEIESVQAEVAVLESMGINKIIALGHSGITKDMEIAAKVRGVDVVIGGHTDTFLYTGEPPADEVPLGPYPLEVTPDDDPEGKVLVVSDFAFGKYLGRLDVKFDDDGRVIDWGGNPILLDGSIAEDPEVLAEINEWAVAIRGLGTEPIGTSHVFLDGDRSSCRLNECNLGNMLTDAFIWDTLTFPDEDKWNHVNFAIIGGGSIRASIGQGDITLADIISVMPFGNTIDTLDLEGRYVREMLERSVAEYSPIDQVGSFLQMSGLYVTYDLSKEPNNRVVEALVRCTECIIPEYLPLEDDRTYRAAMPTYFADGNDGHDVIAEYRTNVNRGTLDVTVISEYVAKYSPLYPSLERRITFVPPVMPPQSQKFRKQRPS